MKDALTAAEARIKLLEQTILDASTELNTSESKSERLVVLLGEIASSQNTGRSWRGAIRSLLEPV